MFDHELDTIVLRRVVALKRFALFGGVDLGELATLAQNVAEATFVPGQRVAAAHEAMYFVLDGAIAVPGGDEFAAGDVLGGLALLARRPLPTDARATRPTKVLQLNAEDLFDLLDDNFGLLRAAIRTVAALAIDPPRRRLGTSLAPAGSLGLVERLLLLRRQPQLARGRIRALAALARASHELTWPSGGMIERAGAPATSSYVIADGTVKVGDGEGAVLLTAGHAFGLIETLAERAHAAAFEAVTPVRALASTQAVLLDVLEDHPDLGLAVLASLAGDVLDRRASLASPVRAPAP